MTEKHILEEVNASPMRKRYLKQMAAEITENSNVHRTNHRLPTENAGRADR